jgi:hypothetical protein
MAQFRMRLHIAAAVLSLGSATACIDTSGLVFDRDGLGGAGAGAATGGDSDYQTAVLEDAPLAYWPLDTIDGGTRTPDISGNGFDANLDNGMGAGTITFDVPGAAGAATAVTLEDQAFLFVGVPHPLAFGDSSYTLEAWVRVDTGQKAGLWAATEPGGAGYNTSVDGPGINHKRYEGGMGDYESMFQDGIVLDSFRHIVISFDSDRGEGQIYVDGQALRLPPDPLQLTWSAPGVQFALATADPAGSVTIDEVAVYDTALAAERVARHFDCADGCD